MIHYSQSWEDQDVLLQGLQINSSDNVLSITSGGDNTLALLLQNPNKIVSVDINPDQNYLLELKIAALKKLDYEDYIQFLGVRPSTKRLNQYELIKDGLSEDALAWWNSNKSLINDGVIHSGKLEKYAKLVRTYFLPFTTSKTSIDKFLNSKSLEEQEKIFSEELNTWQYRLLCKIFLSKPIFSLLGRDKSKFKYSQIKDLSKYYSDKLETFYSEIPAYTNYFLHYGLLGTYINQSAMPLYLQEKNFSRLRKLLPKLTIVTNTMQGYLKRTYNQTFSKFYMSDIFEYLPESEVDSLFEEIVRVAKNNSLLIYWNHLVSRKHPTTLDKFIITDQNKSISLKKIDKNPMYGSLFVEEIKPS